LQLFGGSPARAIGKVDTDFPRFGINHPDFFGAVGEIQPHFAIQFGCGVRFGCDLDSDRGGAGIILSRVRLLYLLIPDKTDVRLQPCALRQFESSLDMHAAKRAGSYIAPKGLRQILRYQGVGSFRWGQDEELSFQELVLQPIVVELLELLEGQQCSGTHDSMILRGCNTEVQMNQVLDIAELLRLNCEEIL
jgi:hypothetical protein